MAQPELAPGQQKEQALRDGGFGDEDINQWKGQAAQDLQEGGFSSQEVKDYFGQKEPDMSATKAHVQAQLDAAKPADGQKQPVTADPSKPIEASDVWDAMKAGWGNSVLGLKLAGKQSDMTMPKNASIMQTTAAGAAQLLGDSPVMLAGGMAGGLAGPLGAAAGAFAAPAAMRKILIDHFQRGDIETASEFAHRVVGTTWEAAKGAITGIATEATGGVGGALAGVGGKVAAQVAAQTTVAAALEGHLPDKKDFINGAIAIGGLHAVGFGAGKIGYTADKLMNIYRDTGAHPSEVLEAANSDPALKGELLSANPDLPIEASPPPTPEGKPGNATSEGASEGEPSVRGSAQDEILSRIGEQAEPEKQSLATKVQDNFNSAYAKTLDYTSVIKGVVDEIGDQPLNDKNAHVLMRLHAAVQDKIQEFVENGTRDFNTGEVNGESYKSIIDGAQKLDGGVDTFNAFRIAKRSLSLSKRGIEQPGSRETDQAFVDAHPEVEPLMKRYVDYRNRVLDYLGDSGRYSKDSIQAMKDLGGDSFAPLKKILEPDPITGKQASNSKEIKRIGSSDLDLVDPFQSDLRDIANMIKMAHETQATNTFVDQMGKAEDPTDFFKTSETQTGNPGKTQIAGYVDGKRTLYDVPEEVADSIKRMAGNQQAMSVWTGLLRPFATALRIGTVNNPLFALRHAWRNNLTVPTLSQTGLKPFQQWLYAPEYLMGGKAYHDFIYDGGATSAIMPLNKGYVDGEIYKLNDKAPFLDKAWNIAKTAGAFSHWAIVMNDNIGRFAEYSRMLDKGASRTEAAFAAREVLPDYQKAGLKKSAWQQITAFLNVHAQGVSRSAQELNQNTAGYIAKNLAYITVPSILLAAAQAGDDAIDDLPNHQKFNYWNVHVDDWRSANSLAEAMSVKSAYPSNTRQLPDGSWQVNDGTIVRVQKPFTNGIFFGSAVEAAIDAYKKGKPNEFGEFLKETLLSTMAVPIPTGPGPILEQAVNRNFYTGQPIVKQSMENKLPEMQYDRYTSETAKVLGKLVSYVPLIRDIGPKDAKLASPVVIDNYIHGWGGTLGYYAVQALDQGLIKAGLAPKTVKPVDTLADIPFVKEFVVRYPEATPQSVQDFDERYKKADEVTNSIKMLMKQGNVSEAVKLQDRYQINMDRMTGVDKAIQNMNASVQKTYQSPDIDPVQKRQLIDGMMFQMTSMAKEGNRLMDEFEKRAKMGTGK